MSENADCPSADQLHRALVGELPPDRRNAIEQHLLECGACAEQTLHSGDLQTYSQALRESAQRSAEVVSGTDAEQLEQLIDRVRSLPHRQEATQLSGVIRGSGETDLESDLIRYLQPARADAELGWLGTYRVLKLLGSGGMGGVFLAEDTQLHRRVALKVMRPDVSGQANADERFLREARAAAAVHHDHIVTIFQVGRDGQVPFLAMEFLEGESLEDRLRRERVMPLVDILRIGREIAEGLAAAHARGLVHRDIKPANIWLESRGAHLPNTSNEVVPPRVKLLDFGLARSADVNFELTSQGMVIGTPAYMAPEQAAGDILDHRADLFSLGIVLYRLATGALPFQGKDAIATLVAIRSDTPGDPRKLRSDLPPALCDLIMQLLHKNPAERPASAAEVARRLAEIPLSASSAPVPRNTPTVAYQRQPPGKSRAFKWIAAAGAIFFLCLMGVIVVVTTDGGQIELNSKVDDVDVDFEVTKPDGTTIKVFDKTTGSRVQWLWSGEYQVALKGNSNSVELDKKRFTLKRGDTEILTLTHKKRADVDPTTPSTPNMATKVVAAGRATIPEPPPLSEWLKGRKVLTVAQDGSGQFKTIQAALDALEPGEAVKVLDKGPYRELLLIPALPFDSGLISEVHTILESPEWKLDYQEDDPATGGKIDVYRGHSLNGANGFRWHGFEMRFPPSNGKRVRRCGGARTKGFVLENCFIQTSESESVEGEPVAISDFHDGDGVGMSVWMRECVIEGSVSLVAAHKRLHPDPDHGSTAVFERNYFLGVGTQHHLLLAGESMEKVIIRHNVFAGKSGIDIHLHRAGLSDSLNVSNNLLLSPTGISFLQSAPLGAVTIRNNLYNRDALVSFVGVEEGSRQIARRWNIDHNAYPAVRAGISPEHVLTRPQGDIAVLPRFLSKVPQEADYLRIPADDPLATAGAGGKWPTYLGALPPGPAPEEGDWFSRLRARWQTGINKSVVDSPIRPPAVTAEPSTIAEWLKGRDVVTVAQDGSGQHKTIGEAIRALRAGQVVKVLDRGPYRERLDFESAPDDTGLISDQQAVIELPTWKKSDNAGIEGHVICFANGFRINGFAFEIAKDLEVPSFAHGLVIKQSAGVVLENCSIRWSGRSETFMGVTWFTEGPSQTCRIRECLFGNGVILNSLNSKANVVIEKCFFTGSEGGLDVSVSDGIFDQITIRENVFGRDQHDSDILINSSRRGSHINHLQITNNTTLASTPLTVSGNVPTGQFHIRNQLRLHPGLIRFVKNAEVELPRAIREWDVGHNVYPRSLRAGEGGLAIENLFPKATTDVLAPIEFLSTDINSRDYLRIASNILPSDLAKGGGLPNHAGAFPPGPPPKEGDWFTRLRERWPVKKDIPTAAPAAIPKVASLKEWLRDREVVTVAQDGSGQHQTIGAAIRALRTGQVVKVLDRGPYKEQLRFDGIPADTGLISEQQTIVETESWDSVHHAHSFGPLNGFRLTGMRFIAPQSDDWRTITTWIQPSGLVIDDCSFARRIGGPAKITAETSIYLIFRTGGSDVKPVVIQNCLFDGGSVTCASQTDEHPLVAVTHNFFRRSFVSLNNLVGTVVVRDNVFEFDNASILWIEGVNKVRDRLEISNNTSFQVTPFDRGSGIHFVGKAPEDNVIIRNNVTDSGVISDVSEEQRKRVRQQWQMDHNAYVRELGSFAKSPSDLLISPKYLSSDPNHRDAWRIAADSELANGGAGGAWPTYIGAFAPGPAPPDGDWFSRLRDKWAKELGRK